MDFDSTVTYITPVPLQDMASAASGVSSKRRSNQRHAGGDDDTTTTMNTYYSDVGTVGCISQHSATASSASSSSNKTPMRVCSCSQSASNHEARRRYLHRLGIYAEPSKSPEEQIIGLGSIACQHLRASANGFSGPNFTSCSAPDKTGCMQKQRHGSLRQSSSQEAISRYRSSLSSQQTRSHQDGKIILLRRSAHYTTKLKSDPKDAEKFSPQPIEMYSQQAPRSPPSKFELSPSWTTLLSKDTASTTSASLEPLDGACDLFSLPSDSSIAASGGGGSTRSLGSHLALDRRLPSCDSLSATSMPKQRKVSFDSTVKAATIPSRSSYSNRMRTRMWSSTENIYVNAVRSEKEYSFDGSDWRTAREESDFFCSSSGDDELVHPAHFCGWHSSQVMRSTGKKEESNGATEVAEQCHHYSEGMFEMD